MSDFLRWFTTLLAVGLLLVANVYGQEDTLSAPPGIFVDLEPVFGWGPFMPRSDYLAHHMAGRFSLAGKDYNVYLLQKSHDPHSEQRILFEQVDNDMLFAEEQGVPVYYRYETVRFDTLVYDIVGFSPKTGQFALTLKENVPYAESGLQRGSPAHDFEVSSIDGKPIKLAALRGNYVLLDFWGTWCQPCLEETPFLKKAHATYGEKVQLIGIAVDDNEEAVMDYVKDHDIGWPQVIAPNDYPPTGIVSDFKVRGYPSLYLIDPDGKILLGPEDQVRLRGERLLETLAGLDLD